jgi:glycogen operon protein
MLSCLKLIAEPWDIGPGGYQLGNHPPGFAEWNDKFRDGMRRFWRGDSGMRPDFAARLSGSSDLFNRRRRKPWASINYIASHDGFTLHDLVSYNSKHNDANGENNNDGHSENFSNNWGAEGPTDDPGIRALRERIKRAMLTTLMFSQGTPMILAGDEFGRTQRGNNNAYCQDNDISWVDWKLLETPEGRSLSDYVAHLGMLRRCFAMLQSERFAHGEEVAPGVLDVAWFDERAEPLAPEAWQNPEARALAVQRAALRANGKLDVVLMFVNGGHDALRFTFPAAHEQWFLLIDSADPEALPRPVQEPALEVQGHSAMLFANRIPREWRDRATD